MTRSLAEEAADPNTTPQRMRELIQTDRSLYAAVACNPNVDEPLRQWLWVNGGRDVQEAMVRQYEEAVRAQKEAREAKEAAGAQGQKAKPKADKSAEKSAKDQSEKLADELKGKPEEKPAVKAAEKTAQAETEGLEAQRQEAERLAAERAEAERRAHEEATRLEAARLEAARLEAERLEAERKAVQARVDAEKAENERLNAEAAARADEQRRLAEQRKAAAELAAIQAEAAQAFADDKAGAPSADSAEDDAESTVVVNRSGRPVTLLVTAGGQKVELTNDVVILGRRPRGFLAGSVQIVNVKDDERTISKTHARLSWHDDAWYISDLGSTNGVSVGFGNSKIELSGSEEVKVEGPFALGLHDMNLEIAQ